MKTVEYLVDQKASIEMKDKSGVSTRDNTTVGKSIIRTIILGKRNIGMLMALTADFTKWVCGHVPLVLPNKYFHSLNFQPS